MVKILNCYLYAKKVMLLCLRVQFFWPSLYIKKSSFITADDIPMTTKQKCCTFVYSTNLNITYYLQILACRRLAF